MISRLFPALLLLTLSGCMLQQTSTPERVEPDPVVVAAPTPQVDRVIAVDTETTAAAAKLPATSVVVETETANAAPAIGVADAVVTMPEPVVPLPPENIWDRIRDGMTIEQASNARIESHINWLKKHPKYLNRVSDRASPYLFLIVEELEKHNMPLELAVLPVVESSFQPFAYSSGRAAGLWQFIPSTGRLFGLKQNWWYDGRRDVVASTKAAIQYLDRLQKRFDGDWLLALASYNAGEGTVIRAQKRNKSQGKPTDFWSLKLPRETLSYVPKLLAYSRVFANPAEFGLSVEPVANEPRVELVKTGTQIDLAKAAKLADIDIDELYLLNPGFNRWATDPAGPHHLLVPIGQADHFREQLASLTDRDRLEWRRHKIASGESLISIAKAYRTTPAVLREANSIKGNLIRAGRHMLIPVASADAAVYSLSADQRRSRSGSKGPSNASKITHVVRSGDNLWDLGRRYGVSTRQIANWNGISTASTLRLGQKLNIWNGTSTKVASSQPSSLTLKSISYTVRNGDSLYLISKRFKVTVANLLKWNALKRSAYLQPGQKLTMHIDVTGQST